MANNELYPYLPMFTEENTLSEETNKDDLTITSCQELLDYEVQPEFFIINPLIPKEAITSITADSGKGKSLFALILAYHIASGLTLFDKFEVDQGKVLIIDQEMNKNTIVTRFKRLIDKNIPIDYIIDQKFMITDNTDFARLLVSIVRNEYKIIIFDTFTEIHDKEENDSGAMKAVNKQILKLIRRTGVSVIYLHHHRKLQKGERLSQSSSRGSSEIIAKVSSHLLLDSKNYKDELGNKVLEMTVSQEKARSSSRLDGKISFKIINDEFENKIKWEYLGEVEEKRKKVEEAKAFIIETLSSCSGATVKDLEEKSDVGTSNIRIALKELVTEEKIDEGKQGKAKYYFINS
ncbi:MAG: AAA family ATPase [Sphaerochaetaceae bacterium]